ncbi:hypothetical protein BDV25DRAFT_136512 [Aspergillus avenaceus]|uniref:Uncharacterized protein n=1 Tax=Aspergillus avenaceus TaxID=36643 RepID=A0A5N6U5R7_ASPAV|nr:hypothetical protein BDV25DRAFT_136512 [Aspergillus avenaceus]
MFARALGNIPKLGKSIYSLFVGDVYSHQNGRYKSEKRSPEPHAVKPKAQRRATASLPISQKAACEYKLQTDSEPFIPDLSPTSANGPIQAQEFHLIHYSEPAVPLHHQRSSYYEPSKTTDIGIPIPGISKDPQKSADVDDHLATHAAKVVHSKDKLQRLCQSSADKRIYARELRKDLSHKREKESQLREEFMKTICRGIAQDTLAPDKHLIEQFQDLRAATEDCRRHEPELKEVEDQLDLEDYRFIKAVDGDSLSSSDSSMASLDNLDMKGSNTSLVGYPPDLENYLSCVGEVRIQMERLQDLDVEWSNAQEKQRMWKELNRELDDETVEILQEYADRRKCICEDLNSTLEQLYRLQDICQRNGHLSDDYIRELGFHPNSLVYQTEDPLKGSTEAYPFTGPNMQQASKSEHMSKWMLHKLQQSNAEIRQLKSQPELQILRDKGYSEEQISRMSLATWHEDETAKRPSPSGASPTKYTGDYLQSSRISKGRSI